MFVDVVLEGGREVVGVVVGGAFGVVVAVMVVGVVAMRHFGVFGAWMGKDGWLRAWFGGGGHIVLRSDVECGRNVGRSTKNAGAHVLDIRLVYMYALNPYVNATCDATSQCKDGITSHRVSPTPTLI